MSSGAPAPSPHPTPDQIDETIAALVAARGRHKTICPSEAARKLATDWRAQMPAVRNAAYQMACEGRVAVLQRGQVVPVHALQDVRGPIRLSLVERERDER